MDSITHEHPRHIVALKLYSARLKTKCKPMEDADSKQGSRNRARKYANDEHNKEAYRAIGADFSPPITFLKRVSEGCNGEPVGSYTTLPVEIDAIIRDAWGKVYAGVCANASTLIDGFLVRYNDFFLHQASCVLDPVDPTLLMDLCLKSKLSAGGLDGWEAKDVKVLSLVCFDWLSQLFNSIEAGADWPSDFHHSRCSYLAKDPDVLGDPLGYRPLLVMPIFIGNGLLTDCNPCNHGFDHG